MKVEVKYYAWIREEIGEKETLEFNEGATVREIVKKLVEKHTHLVGENFLIAVNGRTVDLDTCLNEGDVVSVFPPAGGG
ncbi:MAG: MoaD/ThiS family protein [Thermoproteota archaeon]